MTNKPSRKIPKNYRNITGKFFTNKSHRLISYESKLERDFLYLFEFENIILKIVEQPITIKYVLDKKEYSYTPDFYLETPSGHKNLLVEIKYKSELSKKFKDFKPKFHALNEFAKEKDVNFFIFTDKCQYIKSEEYKFNIHFLLNYNDLDQNHLQFIEIHFIPYITIQEILNLYSKEKLKQFEILNSLYCMIRRKILMIDMYKKLTNKSELIKLKKYDENIYQMHLKGKVLGGYLL